MNENSGRTSAVWKWLCLVLALYSVFSTLQFYRARAGTIATERWQDNLLVQEQQRRDACQAALVQAEQQVRQKEQSGQLPQGADAALAIFKALLH